MNARIWTVQVVACGLVLASGCSGRRPAAADATTPGGDASADQSVSPADGGPADGSPADGRQDAGETPSGPFPTTFEFRNDTATPLFVFQGCIGIDFGVSSEGSGFRDQLGPTFHCTCVCDDASCTGPPVCGACPMAEGKQVPVGGTISVEWNGVYIADQEKARAGGGTFSCVKSFVQPAGRYRVAIRVFADMTNAAAHIGGRVVTRDFELPSAGGRVDVPLAGSAADECDLSPAALSPVCTGAEARDVPCSLSQTIGCAWEGGLGLSTDSSQVTPPATYARRRVFMNAAMPELTCATPVPRCARDSRLVTTSDIVRVISQPTVMAAFAAGATPVYGYDQRANDGSILVLRRPDGTSLGIGSECTGCPRPLTPALRALIPVFRELERQSLATSACTAFGPGHYY